MWIDWFVLHLSGLRPRDSRASLVDLAHEVYPHLGHLDPIEAAQAEFDAPPPQRFGGSSWLDSFSDATTPQARGAPLHDGRAGSAQRVLHDFSAANDQAQLRAVC
jgi:hypothetical protein